MNAGSELVDLDKPNGRLRTVERPNSPAWKTLCRQVMELQLGSPSARRGTHEASEHRSDALGSR
jgi:hypothetical protein